LAGLVALTALAMATSANSVPPSLRIFVGEDHGIVRDGIRLLLNRTPGLELIGQAHHGRALVEGVIATSPDVVITDISMPELNGLDAIRQLKARGFGGVFVVLSSHDERHVIAEAIDAGASVYVHKEDVFERLIEAIHAAWRGERWLSPRLDGLADATGGRTLSRVLSPREIEVLQLFAEGANTKQVAAKLGLSAKTIEYHRLSLFSKLQANGLADLVRIAVKEGLVSL
jgi:DNA-binding NarL/FixJ family response regulator